ncbi:MAG: PilN domain-containing protein [Candidatus Omnitrophica bacterium]|nr:PilN domain-containing protein [Candidatus Omnitrophota bacterium]
MNRINLIPPEFATGKRALVKTGLQKQATVVGMIVLAALAVHYGMGLVDVLALRKQVKILNQSFNQTMQSSEAIKKTTDTVKAQLDNLQDRMILLGGKRSQLLKLKGERFKWSEVLSEFHEAIPNKVWVDELLLSREESHVSGGAFGNEGVGTFINNLTESRYFKNATFARTEAGKLDDRSVINYELTFELTKQPG